MMPTQRREALSLNIGFRALDSMTEGLAILDAAGEYVYMNAIHARMYGYEPGELIGCSWKRLYDEEQQRGFESTAFPALAAQGHWSGESYGRFKDGRHSRYWISLSVADGHMVCCCRDVSDVFRQRAEMSKVAANLDDAIAELRRIGRLKDEFLARVSHELRSPLHAIQGATELLGDALPVGDDPSLRATFATLVHSGQHLRRLIDDLLDVSTAVTTGFELRPSEVSAASLLASAVMIVLQRADERHITLSSGVHPATLVFVADERRVLQIVVNLLTNAVEFTPPYGRISVEIRREGDQICIAVDDSGCGIPADKLGGLFQMFHQVDGSLARSHHGTGLGLFLVRELAELHGGTARAESTLGEGSRFTVTLPVRSWSADTESAHG